MSAEDRAPLMAQFAWGDPDTVAEHFATLLRPGLDGFTINCPANGHIEGRVQLLGETLAPLIS
jgi:alkanesulfonate monooxygenase SsuD/methylene tetrahydromethanopterin reductase-like flavin-dependent oxidoreductase (luciferase family)